MLVAEGSYLLFHVGWCCRRTPNVSQVSGKDRGFSHHLLTREALILNEISIFVRHHKTVNQFGLSLKTFVLDSLILLLFVVFRFLRLVFDAPLIVSQVEAIPEDAKVLTVDLAAADDFDISRFLCLKLGTSHSAELSHVLGHIFLGAVVLNDKDTAVSRVVDPVTLVHRQVLPEMNAVAVGLETFKRLNL